MQPLKLRGACTHNLRSIGLDLRPGQVVAITGASGAGKSSLAMDTLYAEGQRRFVESFSPYVRQFLERVARPPIETLDPIPAAVAVDRGAPVTSSRSTVATMTDIEPLLAGLFLKESVPHCPEHGEPGVAADVSTAVKKLSTSVPGQRGVLTYPLSIRDTEHYLTVRDGLVQDGYRRVWLDRLRDLDDVKPSEALSRPSLDVVVDRVAVTEDSAARIAQAVEHAWKRGQGHASFWRRSEDEALREEILVQGIACPSCAQRLQPPRPGLFSYESPVGACPTCRGFGRVIGVDQDKVIPDPYKSLKEGAIHPWTSKSTAGQRRQLRLLCERRGIPMDVPWKELSVEARNWVWKGDSAWSPRQFGGILGWFAWLQTKSYKMHVRVLVARYRAYDPCPSCNGARLGAAALEYRVEGKNIVDCHRMEIGDLHCGLQELKPRTSAGALLRGQLLERTGYLCEVGLGYLSLDRQSRTLSGGEAQRVKLTAALGTSLHNALFVLDEPTVGLHPGDVARLGQLVRRLASRGNIVVVVEHDPILVAQADRVVELGPGAGAAGGAVVYDGSVEGVLAAGGATARSFRQHQHRSPAQTLKATQGWLGIEGLQVNNLRKVTARFPLGAFTVVVGPSGSGKTSLVQQGLYRALARRLRQTGVPAPAAFQSLEGAEAISRVEMVSQEPLGRTSRGNAATYTKAWDTIRKLFASEASAVQAGLTPSHFSFNVDGGRCEACAGEGAETVEMQFLADVRLECPVCKGERFKEVVLRSPCRGVTIGALLQGTVAEALDCFADVPAIVRALSPVVELGLGYIKLGQPLSTYSGGEAQRLKLARCLRARLKGALFIVDEPSAGLHSDEILHLLSAFRRITQEGGTVVAVEHDLQILTSADWVVEVGPGAGKRGGEVVFSGTASALGDAATATAEALRESLNVTAASGPSSSSAIAAVEIDNAREHNLQGVSVAFPHGALSVVTGPSGSGKSSLVFDVTFAEGQRRFLETLSPYARRFLPALPKPDVDAVSGVPPSIALEQRTRRAGAQSTVATVTEVAHYLRLLYAKLGTAHCPDHGLEVGSASVGDILAQIRRLRGKGTLLAPAIEGRKGSYLELFTAASRSGIRFARCDGARVETEMPPKLARSREHTIELVVAEGVSFKQLSLALLERALSWGQGSVRVVVGKTEQRFATEQACPECGFAIAELDPRWFSFNTVQGRCERCEGTGLEPEVVSHTRRRGSRSTKKKEPQSKSGTRQHRRTCSACDGQRLSPLPAAVTFNGRSYADTTALSVQQLAEVLPKWRLVGAQKKIGVPIVEELRRRIGFLQRVGLGYLTLDRAGLSLSGGEMQRLRLAAQLGAGLTGALYVLDEPTIGLHPRDTRRLIGNLKELVAGGSTVLVVEHDADVIAAADYLVDLGPGGGRNGGRVLASGKAAEVLSQAEGPTAQCLRMEPVFRRSRPPERAEGCIELSGVTQHNLQDVELSVPKGRLTVVCGVSGSGKSTLVSGVLLPAVRQRLGLTTHAPGAFAKLGALGDLARAISVDQSPIGRTPRSTPATFLGIWDGIRKVLGSSPDAQVAGFGPTRFSFNSAKGGRCEECGGYGVVTHEMSFLPDVVQSCPVCEGLRFEPQTLAIKYRGLNVGEILRLSAEEGVEFFVNHPRIAAPLRTLSQLGAGYIQLGQGSHTLSGGEAQRLKLAEELTAGARHEPTLYVLDEPTTGLHQGDVDKLMTVLSQLVERGDTVVVIEHHPWVIAGADYAVELGPDGGEGGGRVIAKGAPKRLARRATPTGRILAELFAP